MAKTANTHLVIMAGGVGSRLYPLSTPECPKQFVDVLGCGKTLIQLTLERFAPLVDVGNVWVMTGQRYAHLAAAQLPQIPADHILTEPVARSTAPCIAYASWRIKSEDPGAVIAVTPSDHLVSDVDAFRQAMARCMSLAAESDAIVTMGIEPERPDTGLGYIEIDRGEPCARTPRIFRVDSFREKPDEATARHYASSGSHLWNAGIFVWSVSTIVNALRVYAPDISGQFEPLLPLYGTQGERAAVDAAFQSCPSISIDYAVMEKAEEIYCHPTDCGWSDLGTWQSLLSLVSDDRRAELEKLLGQ